MRAVFGLVLIVGIALAGGAVMMAKKYIGEYQAELNRERAARQAVVPTVDVYVATRQLKYGETLKEDAVRVVKWPVNAVPEGAFQDLAVLFPPDVGEKRYVLRTMEKDEAIMALKVTKPGETAGINSVIKPGLRAFTISVDATSGVSGLLRPGDRVDVYWTGSLRGLAANAEGDVTKLIEAGVRVIAIDQSVNNEIELGSIARTVTVEVSPEQAGALTQARSSGKLSLSLVGAEDETIASAIEVNQRSLLGLSEIEAAPVQVEEQVCTIRTRRGAEVVDLPIPCTN